jgi:hypothetical protein
LLAVSANLATAHGSFSVDGWKVWNNATISAASRIETGAVPVKVSLPSGQTLLIGLHSRVQFQAESISIEEGCAQLSESGTYFLTAHSKLGLLAGSDSEQLDRARQIAALYRDLHELRPLSQRP